MKNDGTNTAEEIYGKCKGKTAKQFLRILECEPESKAPDWLEEILGALDDAHSVVYDELFRVSSDYNNQVNVDEVIESRIRELSLLDRKITEIKKKAFPASVPESLPMGDLDDIFDKLEHSKSTMDLMKDWKEDAKHWYAEFQILLRMWHESQIEFIEERKKRRDLELEIDLMLKKVRFLENNHAKR